MVLLQQHSAPAGEVVEAHGAHVGTVELDGAVLGHDVARQDAQQRGLAGAVGPQQREQLARLDVEVDAVHDRPVAVAHAHPVRP